MSENLGFILTRSPGEGETGSIFLKAASESLGKGDHATLFLLGDAVWLAYKSRPDMESFLKKGGKVVASGEHLKACGLSKDSLFPSVEIASDTYGSLVDLVMEKFDRVVVI